LSRFIDYGLRVKAGEIDDASFVLDFHFGVPLRNSDCRGPRSIRRSISRGRDDKRSAAAMS
jgi:hypothetical protein